MKKEEKVVQTKVTRNILLILLGFLGLGAIGGGGAMIISPTGAYIGIPLSMLEKSPFKSFLIPGVILFSVLGIVPLLLIIAMLKKPASKLAGQLNLFSDMHWSWTYCIYIAFALIIWIQVQMLILQSVHWLHTFYVFFAIAIITIALLPQVRNLYKR